ncbi:MAG: QacE family quaternary ammonium compound efflux SMR transporter [Desulfobacteraceae bacterium]|jgi:small multidrug resistance pump|nr:MAG: QacE family quaternary ammonium compound efflux SMR transporter [Desulfobacteraceae bacterium]
MKHWLFLSVAILAEVMGTSALKASDGFTRLWPSILVICCYGVAFYFLSLTLRAIPVGVAYAVWAGVGIVLITMAGWLFFDQRLDFPAILGITLIVAGIVVMNAFSKVVPH